MTAAAIPSPALPASPTESIALAAAGATLGRPLTSDDLDTPLSLIGADSLAVIELAAAIERSLDIALAPELAHESTTLRQLAEWIDGPRGAPVSAADPFASMLADSVLPDDVRPGTARPLPALLDSRAILLTGATGFLGARLAADLLARSHARLYCTVRGAGGPAARLRQRLIDNGVAREVIDARVHAVDADLTRPRLGLSTNAWERLGLAIDHVLHAGASVNWIASYSSLRAANVGGTLELLRLACSGRPSAFHFVSSLSVCYAVDGPPQVDERFDPLPHIRGVHLGYAQTKIVAEALVCEAGCRGLAITIHRPALISGDSRSGAFNPDDLLSLLVRGCLQMGVAPDLDWSLDCEPVDIVSTAILALADDRATTSHLTHRQPRHWRECLLWMRLSGYQVRLMPYGEWLTALERATSTDPLHPLRPLRSFFMQRPSGAGGRTIPELYENSRRSQATGAATDARLIGAVARPALDASLLDRYFDAYQAAGYLPPPSQRADDAARPKITTTLDEAFFEAALAFRGQAAQLRSATCMSSGSQHSIISELTAWRSGQPAGIFRYRLELEAANGPCARDVIVKLKPHADDVIAVGEALARLADERVADAYVRWSDRIGLGGSHLRERAIYDCGDERLIRHTPALIGAAALDQQGACALILEDLRGARLLDSVDRHPWWDAPDIAVAIDGLAELHAVSYGHTAPLTPLPWVGFCQSAPSMVEMSDLWIALADHASVAFAAWGGTGLPALHRTLIDSIGRWRLVMDEGPRTLIHNDCNPRNLCLRERAGRLALCAYDWELATIGPPQRDLAELLCFVLPAGVSDRQIDRWVERHRMALGCAAGVAVERGAWWRGLHASMNELLVNRLAMYALVHRIRRQSFLPRVIASWRRIHRRTAAMAGR